MDPSGEAIVEVRFKRVAVQVPWSKTLVIHAYHAYIIVIDEKDPKRREYICRAGPDAVTADGIPYNYVYVGPYFHKGGYLFSPARLAR